MPGRRVDAGGTARLAVAALTICANIVGARAESVRLTVSHSDSKPVNYLYPLPGLRRDAVSSTLVRVLPVRTLSAITLPSDSTDHTSGTSNARIFQSRSVFAYFTR